MIRLQRVDAGYGDAVILKKVTLNIEPGARIGLIGKNGEGKSTLIKTLAGQLPALAGEATIYPGVKIGYFDQHNIDYLDITRTPIQLLQAIDSSPSEQKIRSFSKSSQLFIHLLVYRLFSQKT